ncbi:MAG: DUF3240 family protein [Methylobacillus sp.]|jgi:hypothetical protein|nr:DUF3240 family protein [Methylobacillus sp.]
MNASVVLTLFVPPDLEDALVNWLLENEHIHGFTSMTAHGHGETQAGMTLLEQVTGRQRRVQFLVQTDREIAESLIHGMREQFAGAGMYYILTPVIASGRI